MSVVLRGEEIRARIVGENVVAESVAVVRSGDDFVALQALHRDWVGGVKRDGVEGREEVFCDLCADVGSWVGVSSRACNLALPDDVVPIDLNHPFLTECT